MNYFITWKFIVELKRNLAAKIWTVCTREWCVFQNDSNDFLHSFKEFCSLTHVTWILNVQIMRRAATAATRRMANIYWTLNRYQRVFLVLSLYMWSNTFHSHNRDIDTIKICIMHEETETEKDSLTCSRS